ncbi:MAG: PQQ-binding-like beta-propeller repeat protein [Verrucomicrobia bacterium]|nr:PQQ-binding-like beta-propeller repeat protein [Verrucomicrobiota bacterium]MDA1085972.1 PQQ-binding-like beta-propeller repeat protein [Verrucomicrobiota bacterium]
MQIAPYRIVAVARASSVISGVFCLIVSCALLHTKLQDSVPAFVASEEINGLKMQLQTARGDTALQETIRSRDLALRESLFHRLHGSSVYMLSLYVGLGVLLISMHITDTLRRRHPDPVSWGLRSVEDERAAIPMSRATVLFSLGSVVCIAVALGLHPPLLPAGQSSRATPPSSGPPPARADFLQHWPFFRGADGSGSARDANPPLAWDLSDGRSVRWTSDVPLPGNGSPVVWGQRIYLSGSDGQRSQVYAYDADTGALLWTADANAGTARRSMTPEVMQDTGHAAATVATDGRRVYAIFADGDVIALDIEGRWAWEINLGPFDNPYGHASSPVVHDDQLILQLDQGTEDGAKSIVLSLDAATGRERWRARRDVAAAWSSPILADTESGVQLIACAAPSVIAYDPSSGAQLWHANVLSGEIAVSPVHASGMILASSAGMELLALRTTGRGDVTGSNAVWSAGEGVPDVTSPACDETRVYLLTTFGTLTCLDLATGESRWSEDFEREYYASPLVAGGRVYLFSRDGHVDVVAAADAYRHLAGFDMGQACDASPAVAGRRMFVRTAARLLCVEEDAVDL